MCKANENKKITIKGISKNDKFNDNECQILEKNKIYDIVIFYGIAVVKIVDNPFIENFWIDEKQMDSLFIRMIEYNGEWITQAEWREKQINSILED